jgi:hypothetical protein
LLSNILNAFFSKVHVSAPYVATGLINVLYTVLMYHILKAYEL